jgi:hypothetical protein
MAEGFLLGTRSEAQSMPAASASIRDEVPDEKNRPADPTGLC